MFEIFGTQSGFPPDHPLFEAEKNKKNYDSLKLVFLRGVRTLYYI